MKLTITKRFFRIVSCAVAGALLWANSLLQAQDLHFSQYNTVPLYTNPALAGHDLDLTFSGNYRTQWKSVNSAYTTLQLTAIYPLYWKGKRDGHYGGIGASVFSDVAGQYKNFKTTAFNVSAAYNLNLSEDKYHRLSYGLQVGFIQKAINFDNLRWGESYNAFMGYDPSIPISEDQYQDAKIYPDVTAGAVWFYNPMRNYLLKGFSANSGISVAHINMPNQSPIDGVKDKLPILLKYHGGLEWSIYKNTVFSPNVLIMKQGVDQQINVGGYFGYLLWNKYKNLTNNKIRTSIHVGVWYRLEDSFIYSINIRNNHFNFGFSYDMNRSNLYRNAGTTGAYEVSLAIKKYDPKKRKRKRFSSPLY